MDLSTSSAGAIVAWDWEIGQVNSTLQDPGRVFTDLGTYNVCLTVTDSQGNIGRKCVNDMISVYGRPRVDFSSDVSLGCAPLLVNFDSNSSSDNGEIVEWSWGLGGETVTYTTNDGNSSVFSTYNSDGFYTITLNVKDDKGCEQSITKQDFIQVEEKPEIIISTAEPIGCKFPMTVDFVNFGASLNTIYEWDFGNGETFVGFDPEPVIYANNGDYTVTVRSRFQDSDCTDEVVLSNFISEAGSIDFDFFPKEGCRGMEVQFEDRSNVESNLWEWDFGDGGTSNERDPTHRYSEPGSYTIQLYRRTDECEGTKVSEFQVVVVDDPVFSASFDNAAGCSLPAQVRLNADGSDEYEYFWFVGEPGDYIAELSGKNVSLNIGDYGVYRLGVFARNAQGCVTSLVLDSVRIEPLEVNIVGNLDGCVPFIAELELSSNIASPLSVDFSEFSGSPTLSNNGSFVDVEVIEEGSHSFNGIFTNDLGCRDTLDIPVLLRGGPAPEVDFEVSDSVVCPQDIISFTDLSTGEIDTWLWEVGDSLSFENQNFVSGFEMSGTYDVKLTISSNGCMVSKTLEDYLTIRPPGVNFEIAYNCEEPRTIQAFNTSSNADSIVWSYVLNSDTVKVINQDTIEITFPTIDSYLLSLSGFDKSSGCSNSSGQRVDLKKPEAIVELDQTSGCAPFTLNLTDQSVDAAEWEYLFAGEEFSNPNGPNSSLTLRFGGVYENIGLIVRDIHGCADTTYTKEVTVNNLRASFAAPSPVCFDDTLSIIDFSSSTFGNITSVTWVLGDYVSVSTEETANFIGPGVGKYDIKLIVEDDFGCVDSTDLGLGAFFRAPNFELEADTLACTFSEVRFRNKLHSAGYNYVWDFGDGTSSSAINPTHLYDEQGDFLVNVSIEDEQKCVNAMDLSSIIKVYNPEASFTVDSIYAPCPTLISNFSNESANAVQYNWDFGDETGLSEAENPSHLYTFAGFFDVQLVAIRSEFCTDTLRVEDMISLDGPNGSISFEVDSSCAPLKVSFEAILEEEYDMVWDFGDGTLFTVPNPTDSTTIEHSYLNAGNFVPKIILTNEDNCTIIRTGGNIQANDLRSSFELSDSSFCDEPASQLQLVSTAEGSSPISSYFWVISGAESDTLEGEIVTYVPSEIGFYDIQLVTETEFCRDTIKVDSILKSGDFPMIDIARDTFVCLGESVNIDFQTNLMSEEFYWFDLQGEINPETYVPQEDQFYYLAVENEYECVAIDSILVQPINDQTRFAGPDRTICIGNELAVEISYGQSIFWQSLTECADCFDVILSPDSLETYEVEVISEQGCLVKDTLLVSVLTQDDIFAGEDQKICLTDDAVLLGFALGDYQWSPSALLSNPNDQITATRINESQLFTLTSTKDECTLVDSVLVEIITKAELETKGDSICFGEVAEIFAGGSVDNVEWKEDTDLSSLQVSNPQVNTVQTKKYSVIGELGGCASDTAEVEVFVYPEIMASLPAQKSYFKGVSSVDLEVSNGSSAYTYTWSPIEIINCSSCESITVEVDGSDQEVSLEIFDLSSGCKIDKVVDLRQLEDCQGAEKTIGVPNIFSPNNDGINDLLVIEAPAFEDIETVSIYDRWGQRVFESSTLLNSWDGQVQNTRAQSGVYIYSVTAICPENGRRIIKSGDVTLIR